MPVEIIAYLTFIVSAAMLFAVTLAYAEGAVTHANERVRKPEQFKRSNDSDAHRTAV